jgi:hypothetical protein
MDRPPKTGGYCCAGPKRDIDGESGQGLTELALLLPIFAMVLLFSLYLVDQFVARARAHEAARYVAFASAHMGLRDYNADAPWAAPSLPYVGSIPLGGRKNSALAAVRENASELYAQQVGAHAGFVGRSTPPVIGFSSEPYQYIPGHAVAEVTDAVTKNAGAASIVTTVGKVISWVFALGAMKTLGFDPAPVVTATASTNLEFVGLPQRLFNLTRTDGKELRQRRTEQAVTLIADNWALGDGRNVERGGYINDTDTVSAMQKQVDRLYLAHGLLELGLGKGLTDVIDKMITGVGKIMSDDKLGNIARGRVAMKNYNATPNNGAVANPLQDGQVKDAFETSYDTTHMRDDATPSRQEEGMKNRGPYFMGCKRPQTSECRQESGPP